MDGGKGVRKRRKAKEKGAWVRLKYQPALPREAHCVRTNGEAPESLGPIPYEGHGITGINIIKQIDRQPLALKKKSK